ncbi:MAG TPA: hypothetical protein DDY70_01860 [Clostridiales bacterium]|nr:hypothetical protein [Clostridiales bacterium]
MQKYFFSVSVTNARKNGGVFGHFFAPVFSPSDNSGQKDFFFVDFYKNPSDFSSIFLWGAGGKRRKIFSFLLTATVLFCYTVLRKVKSD